MMADDRWVCYSFTAVQLVSIHEKNSSFPNVVAVDKLLSSCKTEAAQGMSTIILLDGNALFYPAPPDTLDISSV